MPTRRLDDAGRKRLQQAMETDLEEVTVTGVEELTAFGTPRPAAEALLADGPVLVVTAALRAYGSPIGTLAVSPRPGDKVAHAVAALTRRAAVALSASRTYEERSHLAGTLRAALLPAELPAPPGLLVGSVYRPALEATEIGGDFYEMRREGAGWSLTIGDVCGKGVEAAVLSGQVRQSLNTVSLMAEEPAERLRLLNAALLSTDGSSFVTLIHGVMHPVGDRIEACLAGGGHPEPLVRRARGGTVQPVGVAGPIIGMLPEVYFAATEVVLDQGDTLVCFTDGLPEARGADGLLGVEKLADVLADCDGMTAQAIAERLLQSALEHLDGRPHDDMAVITVQPGGSGDQR